jgi:hypothetical protein
MQLAFIFMNPTVPVFGIIFGSTRQHRGGRGDFRRDKLKHLATHMASLARGDLPHKKTDQKISLRPRSRIELLFSNSRRNA